MMPDRELDMFCGKCANTGWVSIGVPEVVKFRFEGEMHDITVHKDKKALVCDCECDKAQILRKNPEYRCLYGAYLGKHEIIRRENPRKIHAEIMHEKENMEKMRSLIDTADPDYVPF